VGGLSVRELRMLELDENLHRQELSPAEHSKTMAEVGEVTAAHLREEAEKAPEPPPRNGPFHWRLSPRAARGRGVIIAC
jgi:hypothetical protein